jgi:hypothetical protein
LFPHSLDLPRQKGRLLTAGRMPTLIHYFSRAT